MCVAITAIAYFANQNWLQIKSLSSTISNTLFELGQMPNENLDQIPDENIIHEKLEKYE